MTLRTQGPVLIVGVGLLGGSIGLALTTAGIDVQISDASPSTLALAADLAVGTPRQEDTVAPTIVIVATPPDVTARVVADQLEKFPDAIVTDVSSVKATIYRELTDIVDADQLTRYVGSHPMAGRERSGVVMARADLFEGNTWVVCPAASSIPAQHAIDDLARDLGAHVVYMTDTEHDKAVAAVSHLPQIVASLTAARLLSLQPEGLALAGRGIRDVTRIAASDPGLWVQILSANTGPVVELLRAFRDDLDECIGALESHPGGRAQLARAIAQGNVGHATIPGKHGLSAKRYAQVVVKVPDQPGQLGILFADVGQAGVSIEDLTMEHSPGAPFGLVTLAVSPQREQQLRASLDQSGWATVE